MATLDAEEIRTAVPPALVLIGDDAQLAGVDAGAPGWADDSSVGFQSNSLGEAGLGAAGLAAVGTAAAGIGAGVAAVAHGVTDLADETVETAADQFETIEELDPVDFGGAIETSDRLGLDDGSELDDMEIVADVSDSTPSLESGLDDELHEELDDLGEFAVSDLTSDPGDSGSPGPMMMDVDATRRKRGSSGPGVGKILSYAAGGLLSLPIVAGILHVMGKPVPVVGDLLDEYIPMGNKKSASRTAAAPMASIDPPVLLDKEPMNGRSLGDEMSADEMMGDAVAPAVDALAEIGGAPEMPDFAISGSESSDFEGFNSDAPQSNGPEANGPESNGPEAIEPGPSVSDPVASEKDSGFSFPESTNTSADEPEAGMEESAADDRFGSANDPPGFSLPGESAEPEVKPEPSSEPKMPSFDMNAEVAKLQNSIGKVSAMTDSDSGRADAVQDLYESISTVAGKADPEAMAPVRPILQSIASDMGLVKAFALASPGWIAQSAQDRQTDGALVVGKLSGQPGNATILLSNKKAVPVDLPLDTQMVPGGIQIGLGRVQGNGDSATISLDLLQGL